MTETIESEIYYGSYAVYILGGHHIDVNPDFYIKIVNVENNKAIELKEKSLKARDFKSGKKQSNFTLLKLMNMENLKYLFIII